MRKEYVYIQNVLSCELAMNDIMIKCVTNKVFDNTKLVEGV